MRKVITVQTAISTCSDRPGFGGMIHDGVGNAGVVLVESLKFVGTVVLSGHIHTTPTSVTSDILANSSLPDIVKMTSAM